MSVDPNDPNRPVLDDLMGSGMVQKLVCSGMGVAIARDPSAMAWLTRLREEILIEERCLTVRAKPSPKGRNKP